MANSKAKFYWVKGRIHIILCARRNIKPGEEILFDYGYTPDKYESMPWLSSFVRKYFFGTKMEKKMDYSPNFKF
jgi:SET domain-containing protein